MCKNKNNTEQNKKEEKKRTKLNLFRTILHTMVQWHWLKEMDVEEQNTKGLDKFP